MKYIVQLLLFTTLLSACGKKVKDTKKVKRQVDKVGVEIDNLVLQQKLEAAITSGDPTILSSTLKHHGNVDFKFKSGYTPLTLAIEKNRTEIILLILQRVKDINLKDEFGEAALFKATQNNNLILTRILIEKGADLNLSNSESLSPLYLAVLNSFEEMALILIKNGASTSYRIPDQKTVFEIATDLKLEKISAIIPLIEAHTAPSNAQLIHAVRSGNSDFVEYLLINFLDYEEILAARNTLSTALNIIDEDGRLKMLRTLIAHGANPNHTEGVPPLIQATESELIKSVEILLLHANPFVEDFDGLTALHYAAELNSYPLVLKIYRNMLAKASEENTQMESIVITSCQRVPRGRRLRSFPNGEASARHIKNLLNCD